MEIIESHIFVNTQEYSTSGGLKQSNAVYNETVCKSDCWQCSNCRECDYCSVCNDTWGEF